MKNVLGNNITLTVFGESHGAYVGAVIDGLCAGVEIDLEFIKECLDKRRPQGKNETSRVENDDFEIVSGVFNGFSTGSPICILIPNKNVKSSDYESIKNLARPSHVDYVCKEKYHSYFDYRGGGHFSGRISAGIVACGAIMLKALETLNIKISSHILKCGKVYDNNFFDYDNEIAKLSKSSFPVINDDVLDLMKEEINVASNNNDSIGGIVQTAIVNLPIGIGEPLFSSLEGELSKALFAIGGIKGVEFGLGFDFSNHYGSEVNDEFSILDGKVITKTNNNGGINGGISNGMPLVFNCAIRPTPSISKVQNTIDMENKTNATIVINGRHDPAIIRRINIVITCVSAFVIADMLVSKYGTDVFFNKKLGK